MSINSIIKKYLELDLEVLLDQEPILPISLALLKEHITANYFITDLYNKYETEYSLPLVPESSMSIILSYLCSEHLINFYNIYYSKLDGLFIHDLKHPYKYIKSITPSSYAIKRNSGEESKQILLHNREDINTTLKRIMGLPHSNLYTIPLLYLNPNKFLVQIEDPYYKDRYTIKFDSEDNRLIYYNKSGRFEVPKGTINSESRLEKLVYNESTETIILG